MEICESNQSHISNKQLLKDQNKDKNEPNYDDEQKVSTDDIL